MYFEKKGNEEKKKREDDLTEKGKGKRGMGLNEEKKHKYL